MNTHDIGRCCSCTVDSCPLPRRKKLHPENGCSKWDNGRPLNYIDLHEGEMLYSAGETPSLVEYAEKSAKEYIKMKQRLQAIQTDILRDLMETLP